MSRRHTAALAIGASLLLLTAVTGCGGDDEPSGDTGTTQTETQPAEKGAGAAQTIRISAVPSGALRFDRERLTAKPGAVTIRMDNPSQAPHAVSIEGNGVSADGTTVGEGGISRVTAELRAGRYEFYCPVPGHREGGMTGTLTVAE